MYVINLPREIKAYYAGDHVSHVMVVPDSFITKN
jgi:hypothetical protein